MAANKYSTNIRKPNEALRNGNMWTTCVYSAGL